MLYKLILRSHSLSPLSYLIRLLDMGNPLQLIGEYDEEDASKSAAPQALKKGIDPLIDTQLDSFLHELETITGESLSEKKRDGQKEVEKKEEKTEEKQEVKEEPVWQACLDSESNEHYYWNTVTGEA